MSKKFLYIKKHKKLLVIQSPTCWIFVVAGISALASAGFFKFFSVP
ncbi:MAG UNVERIFIED_CONTAM: hypothetical protein LVQ98_00980 [Rickettsiaceae bacterium]